jgi:hypothetical protein
VVHLCHGIQLRKKKGRKRKEAMNYNTCHNLDEPQGNYAE